MSRLPFKELPSSRRSGEEKKTSRDCASENYFFLLGGGRYKQKRLTVCCGRGMVRCTSSKLECGNGNSDFTDTCDDIFGINLWWQCRRHLHVMNEEVKQWCIQVVTGLCTSLWTPLDRDQDSVTRKMSTSFILKNKGIDSCSFFPGTHWTCVEEAGNHAGMFVVVRWLRNLSAVLKRNIPTRLAVSRACDRSTLS